MYDIYKYSVQRYIQFARHLMHVYMYIQAYKPNMHNVYSLIQYNHALGNT